MGRSEPMSFRNCLRDEKDRPVPYINIWAGEMPEETWQMIYDPYINKVGIAVPSDKRGVGDPDFTRQAPDRQRSCMVGHRCQICFTKDAPWLVVSDSVGSRTIMFEMQPKLVFTEPWMCKDCALFAIETCPALIRRLADDDLMLCRPTEYGWGYSSGWMEGPLQERSQKEMPAMWAELHVRSAVDEKGRPFALKLART